MIETNPIIGARQANTSSAPPTSSAPASPKLNELGPNAFITLLTAQLQAQDPLNPLDPNQMVTELTSMNTLQETIQIRQDLDALAAKQAAAGGSPASGTGPKAASTLAGPALSQTGSTNTVPPVAAAAMSKGLAALVQSMAPAASTVSSPSNFKSRIF